MILRLALMALLAFGGPAVAQTFQSLGSTSLAVTSASGSVALPAGNFGGNITLLNVGSVEAFVAFGPNTITATTANESVPGGGARCFGITNQTFLAAITSSSTTTLRVSQGSGPCDVSMGGSGGGGGGGDATAANQVTEIARLDSILTAVGSAIPAGTATIGNVNGAPNVTPTNCSGTITSGGTAQNAFTAGATKHGFTIQNLATEALWISFTTTAAADTVASYMLNPSASGVAGGSYSAPFGFGMNTALSVIGATTGNKFSCTWW